MLRIALVIFALWVLAVEPTFRALEQIEQHPSERRHSYENCQDLDQPIPPDQVVAPHWINQHRMVVLAAPSFDSVDSMSLLHRLNSSILSVFLSAQLSLPCFPSALPLRL